MQQLAQGDAFALPIIFSYLYEKHSDNIVSFARTSRQFYHILQHFEHADFASVTMKGSRYFEYMRVMSKVNYGKHLKKLVFDSCAYAEEMICHFAQQLESLKLYYSDKMEVPSNVVFPKLKYLSLGVKHNESDVKLVQRWLQQCPVLETVRLHIYSSDSSNANDLNSFASILSQVPCVKIQRDGLHLLNTEPFGDRLYELDTQVLAEPNLIAQLHPRLQILSVGSIGNIPVSQLHCLKELSTSNEIDSEPYSSLPISLSKLDINTAGDTIPNIWYLKNLTSLSICFSNVLKEAALPQDICSLSNLKECRIQSESELKIEKLPASITTLAFCMCTIDVDVLPKKLKVLFLAECTVINSSSTDSLKSIIDLSTYGTLFEFPNSLMGNMNVVKKIFLRAAALSEFPTFLGSLPCLEQLDLMENNISQIDDSVFEGTGDNFAQLRFLNVMENPISVYPEKITLPKLQLFFMTPIDEQIVHEQQDHICNLVKHHLQKSRHCKSDFVRHMEILQIELAFVIPSANRLLVNTHFRYTEVALTSVAVLTTNEKSSVIAASIDKALERVECLEIMLHGATLL